jgi:hypothetical protein
MSELNRVIEDRLAATETAATSAGTAAAAAQTAVDSIEDTVADLGEAVGDLAASAVVHYEGTEPSEPKNGDTWWGGAALCLRCNGQWFTISGSLPA